MQRLHLLYHELRSTSSEYSYVTPCAEFEQHCAFYAQARSRAEGHERLWLPELTFDDGHNSDLHLAAPILERHRLSATFFITAGWTGKRAGYMSMPELRQLLAAGHRIGAHGLHHKLLTQCSPTELRTELEDSRRLLEDGLGGKVESMSLPGGRSNARVLRACQEAGYQHVFTSVPSPVSAEFLPTLIGRLNLTGGTSVAWLERVLDPASGALKRLERMDRAKGLAKRALGDNLYARLWALANREEPAAEGVEVSGA